MISRNAGRAGEERRARRRREVSGRPDAVLGFGPIPERVIPVENPMPRHCRLLLLPALLASAGLACEGGSPWSDDEPEIRPAETHDFGPTAAFDRRVLFVGPGEDLPGAAIFDFVTVSDSAGLRRGVRARIVDGERWLRLLDEGWTMGSLREPWRLVPRGPVRMVVDDIGEVTTLLYRTDSLTVRLSLGGALGEYRPDDGTQLVIRQASMRVGGNDVDEGLVEGGAVEGLVLDAQLGRAVPRDPPPPPDTGTADPDTTAERTGPGEPDATPAARIGAEAFVVDAGGYALVLATASGGELAWTYGAGEGEVVRGPRLEPTAWADFPEAETQVPTAWRILSSEAGLTGEFEAEATDHVALRAPDLTALGYALVTGWIEDRGERRDVFGLVRHVR